jgi:hypothetical protein
VFLHAPKGSYNNPFSYPIKMDTYPYVCSSGISIGSVRVGWVERSETQHHNENLQSRFQKFGIGFPNVNPTYPYSSPSLLKNMDADRLTQKTFSLRIALQEHEIFVQLVFLCPSLQSLFLSLLLLKFF